MCETWRAEVHRLHAASFKEMLEYWKDSNAEHILSGNSVFQRAVLLTNECITNLKPELDILDRESQIQWAGGNNFRISGSGPDDDVGVGCPDCLTVINCNKILVQTKWGISFDVGGNGPVCPRDKTDFLERRIPAELDGQNMTPSDRDPRNSTPRIDNRGRRITDDFSLFVDADRNFLDVCHFFRWHFYLLGCLYRPAAGDNSC